MKMDSAELWVCRRAYLLISSGMASRLAEQTALAELYNDYMHETNDAVFTCVFCVCICK